MRTSNCSTNAAAPATPAQRRSADNTSSRDPGPPAAANFSRNRVSRAGGASSLKYSRGVGSKVNTSDGRPRAAGFIDDPPQDALVAEMHAVEHANGRHAARRPASGCSAGRRISLIGAARRKQRLYGRLRRFHPEVREPQADGEQRWRNRHAPPRRYRPQPQAARRQTRLEPALQRRA